jgi:GNAT superfamily N-acetyltransferase
MYEIVSYRPELKGQIARLQRHLWGGDEALNAAYFEWKYERNPYLPVPLVSLALAAGEVVGMRGMFGSCWEIGAGPELVVVPCGDDLVIAPDHRHRGLFGRIMDATNAELAAGGHPVTFSLSAGVVAMAGSLARGWRTAASVREVFRAGPGPTSLAWSLARRVRSWPGMRYLARAAARTRRPSFQQLDAAAPRTPGHGGIWCTSEPRPQAMADLVRRLGHDGRIRHVRDAPYLAWKLANPLHDYRFLLAGDDRLEGYLVLQTYRVTGAGRANVVDWEAANPAVRAALLDAAIDWGRFAGLGAWTMSLPREAEALLAERGFRPVARHPLLRQGTAVLVRAATESPGGPGPSLGGRRLLDAASWDMRMLYSMAG